MRQNSKNRIHTVLVIGLGRVGLPQALLFAHSGLKVYAFDRNALMVKNLYDKLTPFFEPVMDRYLKQNIGKNFFPFSAWDELHKKLNEFDAVIFTIGTKSQTHEDILNENKFDFSEYFKTLDQLFLKKNTIKSGIKLIIRTTLPLGGTEKLKNYIEKQYGLKEGRDFFIGFVPERLIEGSAIEESKTIPKIIGVSSDAAFEPVKQLFGGQVIRVKNPITAEFCKLTDNSFRNTLFAFSNEIAMFATKFGIDAQEVIKAVNLKYKRNFIPEPGFVSGYCLSKDPYIFELEFLKHKKERDFHSVWYYGRRTNDYMIQLVAKKIIKHLKKISKSCVAILGLSFKENIDDFRMSHALTIMNILHNAGVQNFKAYDPNLDQNKYTDIPDNLKPVTHKITKIEPTLFKNVDAIVLCVKHTDLCKMSKKSKLSKFLNLTHNPCYIFDGWGIWKQAKEFKHIHYESIHVHEDH